MVANQAKAISLQHLDSYEDLALSDRLGQIVDRQIKIQLSLACPLPQSDSKPQSDSNSNLNSPMTKSLVLNLTHFDSIEERQTLKNEILARMQKIRIHLASMHKCAEAQKLFQNDFEALSPRRELPGGNLVPAVCFDPTAQKKCFREFRQMWNQIRPHCFRSLRVGLGAFHENHACFGGDQALDQSLSPTFGSNKTLELFNYSQTLLQEVEKVPAGSDFELSEVTENLYPFPKPELTFAILTALGSSGNSGLTGWLQSLEDRWLIEGLSGNQEIAAVYKDAKLLQGAKIRYQAFRDRAEHANHRLLLFGKEIKGWNRHNLMAAFLGCQFRDFNRENVSHLVSLLGVGYESKDFVSHLLEGVSLQDSKQNFKEDTNRYRQSGRVGYDACATPISK